MTEIVCFAALADFFQLLGGEVTQASFTLHRLQQRRGNCGIKAWQRG